MIPFLLKKMWKNKWMVFSLLLGNILLVGIVSATPLYTQATMQRILLQNFRTFQQEENQHPSILNLRYDFNWSHPDHIISGYRHSRDTVLPRLKADLDLPIAMTIESFTTRSWNFTPRVAREEDPRHRILQIYGASGLDDNLRLIYGRMPADNLVDGYILETLSTIPTMLRDNLLLDELMNVNNLEDGMIRYMRIVGLYEPAEGTEFYWAALAINRMNALLISEALMRNHFLQNYVTQYNGAVNWQIFLDYNAMRARRIDHYINALAGFHEDYTLPNSPWHISENFSGNLHGHIAAVEALPITLMVLQVPIYVLLALYIFMVSRQILAMEQNEISVLKSRGASRAQLLGIYAMQGLIISLISLPSGLWLGMAVCRMLGASSGFLYLVQRAPLIVEMSYTALLYACVALFFSFLTMFVPVISFSRLAIVEHKQRNSVKTKSLWQRYFLDILCFGGAVYGYTVFQRQQELMSMVVRDTPAIDPLLFIISSLFIIGAGLFVLRLFPYMLRLVFVMGRRFWSPSSYAAMLRVVRSTGEEQFIMFFLIVTMGVGIFSAHSARTINTNNDHLIQYLSGADLMFMEAWPNNVPPRPAEAEFLPMWRASLPSHLVFQEPDFMRFGEMEEVAALTPVQTDTVSVTRTGVRVDQTQFMAIETHTFGETVWFRDDLLSIHINYFLNALAENPEGVLLSDNFRSRRGYSLGDIVTIQTTRIYDEYHFITRAEVVGFVEYWPAFMPMERVRRPEGVVEVDRYLIVANIGHINSAWGLHPYEVWMRTYTDTNHFFYDFQLENGLELLKFYDTKGSLIESRSDPILQGKNGVLTVGFIVTLLICFAGFLIYWLLSIRSRALQFSVFRAMGMSLAGLLKLLLNEQLFITLSALVIGLIVGELCARLFVPLVQLSYTASERVIPLMVVADGRDYANLLLVMAAMVLLCLIILGYYISKIKIDQALKLGED